MTFITRVAVMVNNMVKRQPMTAIRFAGHPEVGNHHQDDQIDWIGQFSTSSSISTMLTSYLRARGVAVIKLQAGIPAGAAVNGPLSGVGGAGIAACQRTCRFVVFPNVALTGSRVLTERESAISRVRA